MAADGAAKPSHAWLSPQVSGVPTGMMDAVATYLEVSGWRCRARKG